MAQVPEAPLPSVPASSAGTSMNSPSVSPAMFGGGLSEGLGELGKSEEAAGSMLAEHAVRFQEQNNQISSEEASTKNMNGANNLYEDFRGLEGKARFDAYPKFQADLEDLRQSNGAELNTPARIMYDQDTRYMNFRVASSAAASANDARKQWIQDTKTGTIATMQHTAAINWQDDKLAEALVKAIGDKSMDLAINNLGKPLVWAQNYAQQQMSIARSTRISMMADYDPARAVTQYRQDLAAGNFTPKDEVELGSKLKSVTSLMDSKTLAHNIMNGQYTAEPETLWNAMRGKESDFGRFLESPKGAVGDMGVMLATGQQMAAQLGLPWDPARLKTDQKYNDQIGQAYMNEQVRKYGGNQSLALAAYNAGPGVVDDWMHGTNFSKKNPNLLYLGDPNKGEVSTEDFVAKIPFKETRDYVTSINAKVTPTAGSPATSINIDKHLPDWLAQADTSSAAARPDDVIFPDLVTKQIITYVNETKKEQFGLQRDAFNTLLQATDGGPQANQPKPTSVEGLLNSPDMRNAWQHLDAPHQRSILNELDQNAKGPFSSTPAMYSRYENLLGEAHNMPDKFATEDVAGAQLPRGMKMKLLGMQANPPSAPKENLVHAMDVARGQLVHAGITLQDNEGDYNQFTGRMDREIQTFQKVHGRQPGDNDIMNLTRQLLLQPSGQDTNFKTPYTNLVARVPDKDAQQIVAAHKIVFHTEPTDDQIRFWYARQHVK